MSLCSSGTSESTLVDKFDEKLNVEELVDKLQSVKNKLLLNPTSYDDLVNLIQITAKLKDSNALLNARNKMYELYPLTPEMWIDWIKDELKASDGSEEKIIIENRFKMALDDYQSIDLWMEYCQYAILIVDLKDPDSLSHSRDIFETALIKFGYHYNSGYLLFDVYREFEKLVIANSGEEVDLVQLARIDTLYRRQLKIPSKVITQTMEEYKAYTDAMREYLKNSEIPKGVLEDYKSSLKKSELIAPFEDKLLEDKDSDSAWLTYLEFLLGSRVGSKKALHKNTSILFSISEIITIFERAVTNKCLNIDIWLKFCAFLDEELGFSDVLTTKTYARAIRNVPWCLDLWIDYFYVLEGSICHDIECKTDELNSDSVEDSTIKFPPNASIRTFDKLITAIENALKIRWVDAQSLRKIWFFYVNFHLRIYSLRNDFIKKSSPNFETMNKSIKLDLRKIYSRALNHLKSAFSQDLTNYNEAVRFFSFIEVVHLKDLDEARSIWSNATQVKGNGSNQSFWSYGDVDHLYKICSMFLNSISDISTAESAFQMCLDSLASCATNIKRLLEFRNRIRSRQSHLLATASLSSSSTKRQSETVLTEPEPSKRPKLVPQPDKSLESIPYHNTKHGEFVTHDPNKDPFTVFVSNLDYSVSELDLEKRFKEIGDLKSIRLVRDYKGRSKGFAYVEFAQEDKAKIALVIMDRKPVRDQNKSEFNSNEKNSALYQRPMFVSECNPNKSRDGPKPFKYAHDGMEKSKLFVKGLDKSTTEDQLRNYYNKFGDLVSVRISTYRNGISKGIAYIEFYNENIASKALVGTDGKEFLGKVLQVSISNPPVKKSSNENMEKATSNGGPSRKSRSQINLIPRSVAKTKSETIKETGPQKSNADFRKMFLN